MKNQNELIEKYIDGELSPEERQEVEKLIEQDEQFSQEFQLRLNVNHAIMENDVMKLRENLEEICRNSNQQKGTIIRRLYERKWHLVAASTTILVVIGSFVLSEFNTPTPEQLFNKHYKFETCIEGERGNSSSMDVNIKTALTHYNNSEFTEAIKILKNYEDNILSKFYLGLSYVETKKYSKAIRCFQYVLDDNNNLFLEQSRWYKGLCFLKLNKKVEAKFVFEKIIEEKELYKDKAAEILKSL